jgi:AbrB family looped-hinge helix DNA binding protein
VIPADIRKVFRIKPGDRLIVFAKTNGPIGLIPAEQFSQFLEHATEMLAKFKKISNA